MRSESLQKRKKMYNKIIYLFLACFLCGCASLGSTLQPETAESTAVKAAQEMTEEDPQVIQITVEKSEMAETTLETTAETTPEPATETTAEIPPETTEVAESYVEYDPGVISPEEKEIIKKLVEDDLNTPDVPPEDDPNVWADIEALQAIAPQHVDIWLRIMDKWEEAFRFEREGWNLSEETLSSDGLCFVVLGFKLNSDGTVAQELEGRLNRTLELALNYPKAYIMCCGGNTNETRSEGAAMKEWLSARGVDPRRILIEERSDNTSGNALYSYRVIKTIPSIRHLVIITSFYHVLSAVETFQELCVLSGDYLDVVGGVPCESALVKNYMPSTLANWMYDVFAKFWTHAVN